MTLNFKHLLLTIGLASISFASTAADPEYLRIIGTDTKFVVKNAKGEEREQGTIPGSHHIVYTEVSARLNELGCKKTAKGWDCAGAKKVFAFCNGPVCPQSPTAIQAMTRDGFPASKIYYYRGGMLDWAALGFPVLKGDF